MNCKHVDWTKRAEEVEQLFEEDMTPEEQNLSGACIAAIQRHFKISPSAANHYYHHWLDNFDHSLSPSYNLAMHELHMTNTERGISMPAKGKFARAFNYPKFGKMPENMRRLFESDPHNFKTHKEFVDYYTPLMANV